MSDKSYQNIAALIFNEPLLCTESYAETILAVLGDKLEIDSSAYTATQEEAREQNSMIKDGVLVVPVLGSMTHRGSWMEALSGVQSYSKLQGLIKEGLENPNVNAILLDMDSPGGTVKGAFDFRDFIYTNRGKKPIYALARDTMASAAYLIGSACDKVYSTQTGQVGSIGVVALHLDKSKKVSESGVKPTFIYAGDYKTAGTDMKPLDKKSMEYLQESVNDSYDMFVKAVAESRGLDEEVIRDTQAKVYRGEKAREIGLVDDIKSFEATLEELATVSQQRVNFNPKLKGIRMDKDEIEQLQADLTQAQADKKTLEDFLLSNGYEITEKGVSQKKEEEMLDIEGTLVEKSKIPEPVLKVLEKNAKEKMESELAEKAIKTLPNFDLEVAKDLIRANLSEKTLEALKAADSALAMSMEEVGESDVDGSMGDDKMKLEKMLEEAKEPGLSKEQVFAKVSATKEGAALIAKVHYNKEKM